MGIKRRRRETAIAEGKKRLPKKFLIYAFPQKISSISKKFLMTFFFFFFIFLLFFFFFFFFFFLVLGVVSTIFSPYVEPPLYLSRMITLTSLQLKPSAI